VIRTRNYLVDIDPKTLEPQHGSRGDSRYHYDPIQDDHLRPDPPLFPVEGFEDARLFWHDGWNFSATVRDRNRRGICQQAVCSLEGARAHHLRILSPAHDRHEKNWMPIEGSSVGGQPVWMYSCYPTVHIWRDPPGTLRGWHIQAPYIARSFRGGSQVIQTDGGDLCIIHESVDFAGIPHRVYQHRFLTFGYDDRIDAISRPFCFERRGVEFAAGMAIRGDDLLISYGVHDAKAMLLTMPLADALAMLRDPLPEDQ
jgi:hypothetical protein